MIVLGAGAAGLMCAIEAGKRGRRVLVLERAERIGKKILISGGGRCNFTNLYCQPENFLSDNPHFCQSALARYTPADFIALVEKHGIAYHEKTLGQLFCDVSSSEIVEMLESECRDAGVEIRVEQSIEHVERDSGFKVQTASSEFLGLGAGGRNWRSFYPQDGGHSIWLRSGAAVRTLRCQECRPALVPLAFAERDLKDYCVLSGISADVIASIDSQQFREKMLITHRGLSGPAILQISSYWKPKQAVSIDLAPEREVFAPVRQSPAGRGVQSATNALRTVLSARLAERWIQVHSPQDWTNHGLAQLEEKLHDWKIVPDGTEGYAKAEVTAGGVDTSELSAKTMESRKVPGLFFIGEVVDVTGHLGGFNFQWAWASGYCAGQAA